MHQWIFCVDVDASNISSFGSWWAESIWYAWLSVWFVAKRFDLCTQSFQPTDCWLHVHLWTVIVRYAVKLLGQIAWNQFIWPPWKTIASEYHSQQLNSFFICKLSIETGWYKQNSWNDISNLNSSGRINYIHFGNDSNFISKSTIYFSNECSLQLFFRQAKHCLVFIHSKLNHYHILLITDWRRSLRTMKIQTQQGRRTVVITFILHFHATSVHEREKASAPLSPYLSVYLSTRAHFLNSDFNILLRIDACYWTRIFVGVFVWIHLNSLVRYDILNRYGNSSVCPFVSRLQVNPYILIHAILSHSSILNDDLQRDIE